MGSVYAILVDPSVAGRLAIKEIEVPKAGLAQAIVQFEAISLNRGEVKNAMIAEAGWRPGWDLAGTIMQQAVDGTGPKVGCRVVGLVGGGAWAEQVAVPTSLLAEIPGSVSFAQAATLPTAGLTALRSLEKGGLLMNRRVLITGSTGGVGIFTHQLARRTGTYVVGMARTPQREAFVREAGADEVVIGENISVASTYGPYHLILDSVGGKTLASVLPLLAPGGVCVTLGYSASPEMTINLRTIPVGTTFYTFSLPEDLSRRAGSEDLAWLAQKVAERQLQPPIEVETSWTDIGAIAQRLLQRQFTGKAVLHLNT